MTIAFRLRSWLGRLVSWPRFWLRCVASWYRAWRVRNPSTIALLVQVTTIGFSAIYITLNIPKVVALAIPSPDCDLIVDYTTQGSHVACLGKHLDLVDQFVLLAQDGKRLPVEFVLSGKSQLVIDTEKISSGEYRPGFKTQKRALLFLTIGGKYIRKSKKFKVLPRLCPPGQPACQTEGPPPPENCELPPSDHGRCIIFANLNWDSARLQTAIARKIVQYGYRYPTTTIPSEDVPASSRTLWMSLVRGNIHVTMEIWLPNQQSVWNEAISRATVIPLGRSREDVWQSAFVVPTYVIKGDARRGIEALAPQLKTVQDLRKYTHVFATSKSNGKSVLVNCPKIWGCHQTTEQQVNIYGLDDVIDLRASASASAHFISLQKAYDAGRPWLGYLWGAGSAPTGKLDLTILKEPIHSEACLKRGRGCGYSISQVILAAHPALPVRAPEVYEFLRKWYFDADSMDAAQEYLAEAGRDIDRAAVMFLERQEAVWTQWVPLPVAMRVERVLKKVKGR